MDCIAKTFEIIEEQISGKSILINHHYLPWLAGDS